jgi:hypothetical protein
MTDVERARRQAAYRDYLTEHGLTLLRDALPKVEVPKVEVPKVDATAPPSKAAGAASAATAAPPVDLGGL